MSPSPKQILDENEERRLIVEEAKSWLKTPFHNEARIKGGGVDCGMLLLEVFEKRELMPHVDPKHYAMDFMLHRNEEWYLETVQQYAYEIFRNALPGDIILYKSGRVYSHGGIIIKWPQIIHASYPDRQVCYGEVGQSFLRNKIYLLFRYDMFERNGDDIK